MPGRPLRQAGPNLLGRPFASRLLRLADVVLAAALGGTGLLLLLGQARRAQRSHPLPRTLLVFTSAYSLYRLHARRAEHTITQRDLGGYFHHVWSVHPLVGASPDEPPSSSSGAPRFTRLAPRHTVLEATVARFSWLSGLQYLNFVLSQAALFYHLHRLCARGGVGVVRGADPYYNGLLALVLSRLYGLPLELRIVANFDLAYESVGALAYPRLLRWRWVEQRLGRFVLSRGDLIVTGSEDTEQFALRNGARRDRVARIGNWSMINPVHLLEPRERPVAEHGLPLDERPFLICVSRLERVKHPEDVLVALSRAREQRPELAGVVVGDGAMREELARLRDRLDLQGHLYLVGDRDQHWLAGMLSRASVIVAPSS